MSSFKQRSPSSSSDYEADCFISLYFSPLHVHVHVHTLSLSLSSLMLFDPFKKASAFLLSFSVSF